MPNTPRSKAASSGPAPGRAELTLRRALLLTAVFGLAVCGNALAASVEAKFNASFLPKALVKNKQTPASLRTTMSFWTREGSYPPPLKQFEIEVDRHARLNVKDIPVCHPGNVDEPPLKERCKEALIGTGKMKSVIQFPESAATPVRGEVGIYNAGLRNGTRTLLAATFMPVPTPAELVITITVEHDRGRYGLKLVGAVPKIAGGAGSVTHLELRLRKSVFSATCPDRHLDARFGATFVEGTHLGGAVIRACTPSL